MDDLDRAEMSVVNELIWEGQQRMREKVTNGQTKHKSEMIRTRREDQICFPILHEVLGITEVLALETVRGYMMVYLNGRKQTSKKLSKQSAVRRT